MAKPTKPVPPKKESFETMLFKRLDRIACAIECVANEIHLHATTGSDDASIQQKIDDAAERLKASNAALKDSVEGSST